MEPEDGCDVLCLVLHLPFDGLKHDVRKIDTDDVEAIAGELIHLSQHEAASCARLVLNDGVDRRTALLQHDLLVTSGYIRLASSRERLPIQDIPVRAGLRKNCGRHYNAQQCYHLLHGSTRPRAMYVDLDLPEYPIRRRRRRLYSEVSGAESRLSCALTQLFVRLHTHHALQSASAPRE